MLTSSSSNVRESSPSFPVPEVIALMSAHVAVANPRLPPASGSWHISSKDKHALTVQGAGRTGAYGYSIRMNFCQRE